MNQLKTIQSLRALAALAVMFAHMHGVEARQSGETPLISSAWLSGVSGVDLFFVISGFIMVWVAGDWAAGPRNAGKFLFARVTRIYPLWWLFAGAMVAYFYVTYGVPWDTERLASLGVDGQEHLIKSFLLIPHEAFPVLTLGWTLMHEMYFYLVFTLVLLLPQRHRGLALGIWALLIIAATSINLTGFYAATFLDLLLFPMTLEFLMGVGIGLAVKAGWNRFAWLALLLGFAWLGWAVLSVDFTSTDILLPTQRTFYYGPAFALIIYGLVTLELRDGLGRWVPKPLVQIGDWSYALYLSHLLVLSAIGRVYFTAFGGEGYLDNVGFVVLASVLAIATAGGTYLVFEAPLMRLFRTWRKKLFDRAPAAAGIPAE